MTLPLLFPSRLARGDTIGLVAPASPPDDPAKIDQTIDRLTAFGFRVKPSNHLRQRNGYLAGSDEERAGDLNAMFTDPEVKGIFALRGGYGSCRLLPLLDYADIRAHPKAFIGFSDITALHVAMLVKAGLATYHGPDAMRAFLPGNIETMERLLLDDWRKAPGLTLFSRDTVGASLQTVMPGHASGRLLGGNMTCLLRVIGTPYAPDFRDAILFLEDTNDKAYRIDGLFTHLRLAGILSQIGGLVLGQFDHPDPAEQDRIAACLKREGERIGVPCVSGAPIGHFQGQITVLHGASAELDADAGKLSLM